MGLLTRYFAATPENPTYSLNDPRTVEMLTTGTDTSTGLSITPEKALGYSPWWRGINLISGDVAKLPLRVFRRVGDLRQLAREHPAYWLLDGKPNESQTAFAFKRQLTGQAITGGNGYAYIERAASGAALNLLPVDPQTIYPVRANGVLWYVIKVAGENRAVPARDVLHVMGFSVDGLTGISVFDIAREALGLGLAGAKYHAISFKNAGRPSVVLETPGTLRPNAVDELRQSWERMHVGLENAHRTAILQNGTKANILTYSAEDSQLIEGRTFSMVDIANFLNAPLHKVGYPGAVRSFASIEQDNLSYLGEGLDHWLNTWEYQCWDKLLTEEEKRGDLVDVEFDREMLGAMDFKTRVEALRSASGGRPIITPNEARAKLGLNPSTDPEADVLLVPLNMGTGGPDNEPKEERTSAPPPPPAPPPAKPGPAKPAPGQGALAGWLADTAARMARRVHAQATHAAQRPAAFPDWVDGLVAANRHAFGEAFAGVERELAQPAGHVAEHLLQILFGDYDRVASQCTAANLAEQVQLLAGETGRYAAHVLDLFLGGSDARRAA